MKRWYVVNTRPRFERVAQQHLRRQNFVVFLPEYQRRRSHARRVEIVAAPLFPNYLFVEMNVEEARWRAVSSTNGVSHLICAGDVPVALPIGVVEEIQSRRDQAGFVVIRPSVPFSCGDAVKITAGPFAEQIGFYECSIDEDRVVLLLDMLGRELKVRIPLTGVEAAA